MEQQTGFLDSGIQATNWNVVKPEIRLLLINGNRFYAEGLQLLLKLSAQRNFNFHLIGNIFPEKIMLQSGLEETSFYKPDDFDLILLATQAANFGLSLQVSLQIRVIWPEKPIIWLDVPDDARKVISCISSGANGFVLEDDGADSLVEALTRTASGDYFCPTKALHYLFTHLTMIENTAPPALTSGVRIDFDLTSRELEVLRGVVKGWNNRQIATEFCIEVRTVKNHIHSILQKLQAHNRYEAVIIAVRYQLVT